MHQTTNAPPAPPPRIFGLMEGSRAASEYGWFLAARQWLAKGRSGAGRAVLVLPGLEAADWSTKPLRTLLSSVGYHTYGWGLGRNVGPTDRIITGLDELLLRIRDTHRAPVSVVGQSLGGSLGRELARRHPGAIDRLISLGTPVTITDLRQSRAGKTYRKYASEHLPQFAFERWSKAPQPPIPATSIYSRSDGVVHWNACHYSADPLTENIVVHASHIGLGVHPAAVYAVLDRLAAPIHNWARFAPPTSLRAYFPTSREAARG
jgi:pimeloyl-ACP methyl ester carboxylesterase